MHGPITWFGFLVLSQVASPPAPLNLPAVINPLPARIGEPTPAVRPAEEQDVSPAAGPIATIEAEPSELRSVIGSNDEVRPAIVDAETDGPPLVQPASAQAPLVPVQEGRRSSATLVLTSALQPPDQDAVSGQPLRLREAIGRTSDSRQMLEIVKGYWQLSHTMCQYHYCLEEEQFLANLQVQVPSTDQLLLAAAQKLQRAHRLEARLMVSSEQYTLTELMGVPVDQSPLAADSPWVGKYRTNFETLFAGRAVPPGMRRIDGTLPQFLQLIDARAEAVLAATDALLAQTEAYAQSRASLSDVLVCHERLRQARLEFLISVREYNQSIADYAIQAVGTGLSPDTVITMLIQPVTREKSVLVSPSNNVQPATAIESAPTTRRSPATGVREVEPSTSTVPFSVPR